MARSLYKFAYHNSFKSFKFSVEIALTLLVIRGTFTLTMNIKNGNMLQAEEETISVMREGNEFGVQTLSIGCWS